MKSHIRKRTADEFKKEVFGGNEGMIKAVRNALGDDTDEVFLTDEIILAQLHTEITMKICDEQEYILGNNYALYACCVLLGSICHVLASRAKNPIYSDYSGAGWLKKSQDYYAKAALIERAARSKKVYGKAAVKI